MEPDQKFGRGIISAALPPVDINAPVNPGVSITEAVVGAGQPQRVPAVVRPFAGFGSRFLATILDSIALGALAAVFSFLITLATSGILFSNISSQQNPLTFISLGIGIYLIQFLVQIAITVYYFVLHQHKNGQTFGKRTFGVKVIDIETGETPSIGKLALRETIGKWISFITIIGMFMPLWDAKKQALHDKIAGTVVVRVF